MTEKEKMEFYSREEIARQYDEQRFGGPSGRWVHEREMEVLFDLLPTGGRILDLACGTGRLSVELRERGGYEPVAADSSSEMLAIVGEKVTIDRVRTDALKLPFSEAGFDAVVALRLAFHLQDLSPLLKQMSGVLRPGGSAVIDTLIWTPRALLALGRFKWGGKMFTHPPSLVRKTAAESGLEEVDSTACFLISPYVYRLLPLAVVRGLSQLERLWPPFLLSRVFWGFRKV